ncbi:MAG: biotin/lipoyl-binding protein [Planctomycetia bacterium]|nr:biotin/lipoyl-binding protein [Planctomycetia bacterium]
MVSLADSLVSSAARVMKICVRTDLESKRQYYLGRSYWVVKDPVGLKYFRFQDEEYFIMKQLDGTKSLDVIKENFEEKFPPQKITLEELQSFIGQLHQSNLILAGVPNQGHELLKRRGKLRRQQILAAMSNILAIRFKGIDLDVLLGKMIPYVRWMFHPVTLFCCIALMLAALSLVLTEFDYFRSKLPDFQQFFGAKNIFLLSITLMCTKILHEFGHGLSCKYLGGECHEMGIMILVLTPCLYCNVSDSWMLPSKWQRAAIGLAGVFVECTLASICTFFWWFTSEGTFHYLCLNVMFISSVSTVIFNINPLLRYDGYYVLADLLEIPNLRQKATKIMTQKASAWFLGMEEQEDPFLPKQNQFLFALYTIAAVMYRWVVMCSILFFVYRFFDSHGLKIFGQIIAAMSLYGLLVLPLWKIGKFFWVPGRIYRVKKLNFYCSLAGLGLILAFCAFVPLPYSVYAPLVLELRSDPKITENIVVPKTGGQLIAINVKEGDFVKREDVLGQLRNPEIEIQLAQLQGNRFETEAEYQTYRDIGNRPEAVARLQEIEEQLETLNNMILTKQQEREQLSLCVRKVESGIVVSPYWKMDRENKDQTLASQLPEWEGTPLLERNLNTTLAPGTHFCSVGDPRKLEAVIIVDQSKIDFIEKDQKVKIKLEELPAELFYSQVADNIDIEYHRMESVPIQLSTKGGGAVATETVEGGIEKPQSPSYRVRVDLDNEDLRMRVGMTGTAKIKVRPLTITQRLWKLIRDVFNFKL